MAPLKSSLARSIAKLLGVSKDTDLSLRGDVQNTRYVPPPVQGITATGGTITNYTSGGKYYKVHTFSHPNSDNFVVTSLSNEPSVIPNSVDYLVVAGGGSGGKGSDRANGGGGAGGFRVAEPGNPKTGTPVTASVQTYPVTVGDGGVADPGPNRGGNSVFGPITSTGGGSGGNRVESNDPLKPGGSGAGESHEDPDNAAGSGNTPPVSPSQGFPGGTGYNSGNASSTFGGGGGGGASAAGGNAPPSRSGHGGAGHPSGITGSTVIYAGGGGGGSQPNSNSYPGGDGGPGGGGAGAGTGRDDGVNGTDGLGGGGGGAKESNTAGNGGSGVVIVRYEIGASQYTPG